MAVPRAATSACPDTEILPARSPVARQPAIRDISLMGAAMPLPTNRYTKTVASTKLISPTARESRTGPRSCLLTAPGLSPILNTPIFFFSVLRRGKTFS